MIQYIPAKTILSAHRDGAGWFGMEYNMNLYRGCCHGCIYCDSRCDCYHVEDFDRVRAKANAIEILTQELAARRRRGAVGMGSMSDPYNPFEAGLRLTQSALERLAYYGFGAGLATKSDLILRDIPLLQRVARHAPAVCKITITCLEDSLAQRLEPGAPASSRRFQALQALAQAGLFAGVLLMPVLPWITDSPENILGIVERAAACGARFVYPGLGVTLRMNQRAHYYQQLEALYPGLAQRYAQSYGEQTHCSPPRAHGLWQAFEAACKARRILYRMEDIVAASRAPYRAEQTSLLE